MDSSTYRTCKEVDVVVDLDDWVKYSPATYWQPAEGGYFDYADVYILIDGNRVEFPDGTLREELINEATLDASEKYHDREQAALEDRAEALREMRAEE